MTNQKAHKHVKKGLFALFIGTSLLFLYQRWQVTGWLDEVDNVLVTMLVVIVPLVLATEMAFCLYHLVKNKLKNTLE